MKKFYEVTIIGGGIVGLSLSIALAQKNIKVLLLEKKDLKRKNQSLIPDLKISSINILSANFFQKIGVWKHINSKFCTPFKILKVWEYPFLSINFNSKELNTKELGFLIEDSKLKYALIKQSNNYRNLKIQFSSELQNLKYNGKFWRIYFNKKIISTKVLIGADGINSWVRNKTGLNYFLWKYKQTCFLAIIKMNNVIKGTIWQEFNKDGPKSILPLYDNWSLLIWYDDSLKMLNLIKSPLIKIKQEIIKSFKDKIKNDFFLVKYKIYPILGCYVENIIKPGLALVGDAAHVINPLAGQGLNLGIKDVIVLSKLLITFLKNKKEDNLCKILKEYQRIRYKDNIIMQFIINTIYLLFSNKKIHYLILRNLIILFISNSNLIKKIILKYASTGELKYVHKILSNNFWGTRIRT